MSPDTEAERNALKEHVYPKLRDFCRENYGIEFQVTGCIPFFFYLNFPLIYSFLSYLPSAQGGCKFQSCTLPELTFKCLQIYIMAYTAVLAWKGGPQSCVPRSLSLKADRRPAEIRLPLVKAGTNLAVDKAT